MAWLLKQESESSGIVPMDVEPPLAERNVPRDWYGSRGIDFTPESAAKSGVELPEYAWPRQGRMKTKRKELPHMMAFSNFMAVSDTVKDSIERFEPGVHDFRPVDLSQNDGTPYPRRYHAFHCRRRFDDIVIWEASQVHSVERGGRRRFRIPYPAERVVIDKNKVAGAHLWVMTEMVGGTIVVSEQLFLYLSEQKLLRGRVPVQLLEQ